MGDRGEAGGKDKRRKVRKTIKERQKHGEESWGWVERLDQNQ